MNFKLVAILCLVFVANLRGQDYELPEFGDVIEKNHKWDTSVIDRKLYWPNGKIKIDYKIVDIKNKIRFQYNENGTLKHTVPIYCKFGTDTTKITDTINYETVVEVTVGFLDVPNGEFVENFYYSHSDDPILKVKGTYKHGKKVGTWYYRDYSSYPFTTIANYVNGRLNGRYDVFYVSDEFEGKKLKYSGNYCDVNMAIVKWDHKEQKYIRNVVKRTRRCGDWTFYNKGGELIETVKYLNGRE